MATWTVNALLQLRRPWIEQFDLQRLRVGSNIADERASISDRNTRELTSYIMRDYEELIGSFVSVLRVLKRS